jgi:hypothetical protein
MTDAGDRGGGLPGGSGAAGDQQSGHPSGGHPGGAHPGSGPASGADRSDPSRRREPYQDLLDPRGPMGMPKIVSRAANSLGRGQHDGGNVAAGILVLSVLAIIIALGILFIV